MGELLPDGPPKLSPEMLRAMADGNPLGLTITTAEVESWLAISWPMMLTYNYTKRGLPRAIVRWWSQVSAREIEMARARLEGIEREAADEAARRFARELKARDSDPPIERPVKKLRIVQGRRQ